MNTMSLLSYDNRQGAFLMQLEDDLTEFGNSHSKRCFGESTRTDSLGESIGQ